MIKALVQPIMPIRRKSTAKNQYSHTLRVQINKLKYIYMTFYAKRDHVPELVIGQKFSTTCVLSILRFPYFRKRTILCLPFCARWVLHMLSIIHVKRLLSATRCRPVLHIMECQSCAALPPWQQKLLYSISQKEYQLRFASNEGYLQGHTSPLEWC